MPTSWFEKLLRALSGQPARPQPPPKRYPLTDEQKLELARILDILRAEGVLLSGEASLGEAIDVAETMGIDDVDEFYGAASVLASVEPLANLAFFSDQVEVDPWYLVEMVEEVARLAGRDDLTDIKVRGVDSKFVDFARRGQFGPDNAVVAFTLDGVSQRVPFLAFSKNLPIGLFERLANVFIREDDPRRFYSAHNDQYEILTRLTEEQARRLNAALRTGAQSRRLNDALIEQTNPPAAFDEFLPLV